MSCSFSVIVCSVNGLKLIHPEMIGHAETKQVKLMYKSAFNPTNSETEISGKNLGNQNPVIILQENLYFAEIQRDEVDHYDDISIFIADYLSNKQNIKYVSFFPDSIKLISTVDKLLDKKLKHIFGNISSTNCSLISVINIKDKNLYNNLLATIYKNIEIIVTYEASSDILRIAVSPEKAINLVRKIHKKIVDHS